MQKFSTIVLLFVLCNALSLAQNRALAPVEIELQRLAQHKAFKHGQVAFMAMNLDNGDVVAELDAFRSMVPASVMKLMTTAVAYKNLGANYRFLTPIAHTGQIEGGVLHGDLIVYGQGDPTLQSRFFISEINHEEQIWNALNQAGIKSINGRLILDLTKYEKHNTPDGWAWEDMGNYFGATPTAMMWEDNMMRVQLRSGQVGSEVMLAKPWPADSPYRMEIKITASENDKDDAWFFSAPKGDVIYGKGTIPAHQSNFEVKISDPFPEMSFAKILSEKLNPKEIVYDYDGITSTDTTTITKLRSPKLSEILAVTNFQSVNLYAEALNIALDPSEEAKSVEGGLEAVEAYLKKAKIPSSGMRRLDGSGISPMNRLTPQIVTNLLMHMYHSEGFDGFYQTLPVGGESGTLKYYFKTGAAKGNLHAKSGTMKGTRNYAGYVKNKDGQMIAFALFMNDFDEAMRSDVMKQVEILLEAVIAD